MLRTEVLYKIPSKRWDREKKITFLLTVLSMLMIYLAMNVTNLPRHRRSRDAKMDVDVLIEKYRPKRHMMIPAPISPISDVKPSKVKSNTKPIVEKKENTSDMLAKMETLFTPDVEPVVQPKKMGPASPHENEIQLVSNNTGQLDLLTSVGDPVYQPMSHLKRAPQINQSSTSLTTMTSHSNPNRRKSAQYVSDGFDKPIPTKDKSSTDKSTVTQINMIHLPDNFKTQMPKIFVNISQWMKDNPKPLPNAVKKFMGFQSNDLTSKVDFKIKDRFFEIYLLCIESTYEIKICLIEGDRTTLLIDEGFKHESHYLRTGQVYRTRSNEILSFGTKQEAASKNETQEFYQIFLSWWKTTGMDKL